MTHDDTFTIAGKAYHSRLLVGTGKYKDMDETRLATEASGAQIVTVAIRRSNIGQNPNEPNLLDVIPPEKYTILPNTAGCYTADDAVRTCLAFAGGERRILRIQLAGLGKGRGRLVVAAERHVGAAQEPPSMKLVPAD